MDYATECKIAFSYTPNDFYLYPKMPILDDLINNVKDTTNNFKKFFCMALTLYDLHFLWRTIERSKYPAWHIRLFNYFILKVYSNSVLLLQKKQFGFKVSIEEGLREISIMLVRYDTDVKVKIIKEEKNVIEEKGPDFYKSLYSFLIEVSAEELKPILTLEGTKFLIKIDNRQLF